MLFTSSLYSQEIEKSFEASTLETGFSDCQAIINTTENFFIGDHTGSIKHKSYRCTKMEPIDYVNKNGE